MKVNLGFKIGKKHFEKEWSEPIEEAFDKSVWIVIETKGYWPDYKIFLRKPFDLKQGQSMEIHELLETLAGTSGLEPILKLAEEMPDEWELLTDA